MQIFEFHFNPKTKEDLVFDTFVYEPEGLYEQKLGSLYLIGELAKVLTKDSRFLGNLAEIIKKEFYSSSLKKTPETSLRDALKRTNEYLQELAKEGNIDWLGNLSFGILNVKDYALNLTKIGGAKVVLIRQGEIIDLGQSLESQAKDPLKTFGNIATGKLAEGDKIFLLTKGIAGVIKKDKGFLKQLTAAGDEKEIKAAFQTKKESLSEVSGAALIILINQENQSAESLVFQRGPISFKKALKPILKIRKIIKRPRLKMPGLKLPRISFRLPGIKLKMPRISLRLPAINLPKQDDIKKKLLLILLLIILLIACFFIFSQEKESALQQSQQKIAEARGKIGMAQNFIILKENEKARLLFQEASDILAPLTKAGMPQRDEARSLRESIEEYLKTEL